MTSAIPFRILFVCRVNLCRSVFAERLARHVLPADRFVVTSAGTRAESGQGMHPFVRSILTEQGVDAAGFAARRLTPDLVAEADLVLAASTAARDAVIAMVPGALRRTFTMKEFARLAEHAAPAGPTAASVEAVHSVRGMVPVDGGRADDIADPPGTMPAFRQCAAEIGAVLRPVVAFLVGRPLRYTPPGSVAQAPEPGTAPHRQQLGWRQPVAVALSVGLLMVAGLTWIGIRGWQATEHLQAAAGHAQQLQRDLAEGDVDGARVTLVSLQHETGAARQKTTDPGWRFGGRAVAVGPTLAAIGTVTVALDDLVRDGLTPLVEVADDIDPNQFAPRDGKVDLEPIIEAGPTVMLASQAATLARDRVAAVPRGGLPAPVAAAMADLDDMLAQGARDAATAARIATLAPPLLGADGPRRYLVLFQNPAEVRATGGMPGSFAVVRADNGKLEVTRQGAASSDLKVFDEPVLPLPDDMVALYTQRPAIFPANVNLTPHFPTAAQLAREMYRVRFGEQIDGVVATDPIALSYVLEATGPLPMPEGPALNADNAVRLLLADSYDHHRSKEEQDNYFTAAATEVFRKFLAGTGDPVAAIPALARAAGEYRLLLWSADAEEQEVLAETVLAGELPAERPTEPTVGVFLNDGTGAKLGYYLTQAAELTGGQCREDGRKELSLRVTLGSTAPREGLPPYVLGLALGGEPYTIRTLVSVFSPVDGSVVDVRLDGEVIGIGSGQERDRAVGILTVDLSPGESRTLDVTLLTAELPANEAITPRLRVTPAVTPWIISTENALICTYRG